MIKEIIRGMDVIRALALLKVIVLCFSVLSEASSLQFPEQIHISYGSSHDSMVVMWSSRGEVKWEVHYGTSRTLIQMMADSTVATLPDTHFKAAKYIYRSELKNLTPATIYFYKIVSRSNRNPETESSVFSFKTLPEDNEHDAISRFVVYGDMGARMSDPTRAAIETFRKNTNVDAILHVGDFAYDLDSDGGQIGDIFMNEIQSFAAEIPYMTAPGNHEIPQNFEPYRIRFSTPNTSWPIPLDKMWYSFDVGLVHFISYSTEVYFANNEEHVCGQFQWLLQDLIAANKNRDKRPWIIAMGHRPMYCSNNDGDDCTDAFMRRWVKTGLEPLFNAQGVDLVIEAHEHSYERLYPMYNGEVERFNYTNPRAPVHIISGSAGSLEGIDGWSESAKHWSAFRSSEKDFQSFGILEIHNRTHLLFRQNNAKDNLVVDEMWLKQNKHEPFVENVDCFGRFAHASCVCEFVPKLNLTTFNLLHFMVN
ncbi:acid phosphatase type 7-like isoform X2 [Mercenaria mercenaria]|uniref:acid phosphatase type 7-like isoform X2 n=1 Tax=Mercenaria mercenaria TaxID=6596 RepID=UPI00234E9824|nr:acid phosphatase type 7-like isoform X2 [Mercenaria mercenaria]